MTVYVTRQLKIYPKSSAETVISPSSTIKDNKSIGVMITAVLEKGSITHIVLIT